MTETLLKTEHTEVVKEDNGHEMIKRPVAVGILAYLTKTQEMIMVKQERGNFGTIYEIPAGKVDEGEDPETAVRRELEEETGYRAEQVRWIIDYYPSVGYSTEEIKLYYTEDPIDTGVQRLDDNERITILRMKGQDVFNMIANGEIKDSKTIIAMIGETFRGGFDD